MPISLSVFFDNTIGGKAKGNLLIEGDLTWTNGAADSEEEKSAQYFEVTADSGILRFQKLNKGLPTDKKNSLLSEIILTNAPGPINVACALMNDFKTVSPATTTQSQEQYNIVFTTPVNITNVAFIFYGSLVDPHKCDATLFQMKAIDLKQSDYQTSFRLT